ncbi:MAG: hypothetical protein ACREAA_17785 [Candidatus Polarisedimenticolia bacterium]
MRRGSVLAAAGRVLAALALLTIAAGPPAASTDLTVDEIVARHIEARGGLKKLRSIQTLREHGRVLAGPNRQALVTRQIKRPDQVRLEFTVQGVTSVYVSDGRQGWKMSPFDGDTSPTPLPEQAVTEAAEQVDIEGPLVDWKAKGHTVELVGHEMVGGHDSYKLKITLPSGAVRHEYIDVKDFQRLRTDSTRLARGRNVQIQTTFSDFRKTGGVAFPHVAEVVAAGRPQRLIVRVDRIEINPPLSDGLFAQ